jgi:hypothetical protein
MTLKRIIDAEYHQCHRRAAPRQFPSLTFPKASDFLRSGFPNAFALTAHLRSCRSNGNGTHPAEVCTVSKGWQSAMGTCRDPSRCDPSTNGTQFPLHDGPAQRGNPLEQVRAAFSSKLLEKWKMKLRLKQL